MLHPLLEETMIKFHGHRDTDAIAQKLWKAFEMALAMETKLPRQLIQMDGMSGKKFRYLLNNINELVADARYFEIGSWKGSTLCSAIFKNKVKALAIDNWSEHDGPKDEFRQNVDAVLNVSPQAEFQFIEGDFNQINYQSLGKFNIYFFDGPHEAIDQYNGVKFALPALDDNFILMVDDWNWEKVRVGTLRAIQDLNLKVNFAIEITTIRETTYPAIDRQRSEWHNGYFMAALAKTENI